ncbi:hypothetical protein FOZ61_005353 [Perkinsus olseni]|uniref:CDP-diacylglycerol--inositol 3-phosphatidyltransferase n=1 Tax=Perkinsus olseni TaxID=32597 RepID=A0A7J6MYS6_PEROL|nr:hypothetical protein FOZ61_005353 [Perkinsus olseni]KAF4676616.1 hypothetical protein FOL46_000080 [Perkinsus olseni]
MVSVYLFVPNLIGYTRVALMLISFYVAFDNWKAFIFCYFWSQMLDAFDGAAARRFNECSMFGAVLDMVTDRISSNILALILSHFYPTLYLPLVMFAVVDYASHWTQMYSSVLAKNGSHKYIAPNRPWLLRKYYGSRVMLFTLCFAQEAVLVLMYLYHFVALPTAAFPVWMQQAVYYAALAFLPIALLKQVINVIQLIDAGHEIVKIDEASRAEKVE